MNKIQLKKMLALACILSLAPVAGVFAAETKVEGVLFANYSLTSSDFKITGANSAAAAYDYNTFDVTRIYVTASTKYTPNITSKIVLEATTLNSTTNAVFLKNAFLQWKDDTGTLTVEGGMPGTLWISPEEGVWKYRFIEKVQTDLESVLKSADKGVKVIYKLPKGFGTMEGMLANGEGYNAVETADYRNKPTKDGQVRLSLTPLKDKKFSVSALYLGPVGLGRVRNRVVGGVAYQGKTVSLGASAFRSVDFSVIAATVTATGKAGYSVYTNVNLNSSVSLFGRYDYLDQTFVKTQNYKQKRMQIYGVAKELAKDVKLALTQRVTHIYTSATVSRRENITSMNLYAKF